MHQVQDWLHSEALVQLERLFLRELVIFIIICGLLGSFLAYGAVKALDPPPAHPSAVRPPPSR